MDSIDLRDKILRTFLEYGIKDCDWCGTKKTDLAECAEELVKKFELSGVLKPFKGTEEDCFNRWLSDNGFYEDNGFYKKEYKGKMYKRLHLIDMYNETLKP